MKMEYTYSDADALRFLDKVEAPDDLTDKDSCWFWTGARHSKERGYGKFRLTVKVGDAETEESHVLNAHKASYLIFNGPVEDGQVIGHECNNEFCASPHHLVAQTQSENMEHCVKSGRHNSQRH